MYNIIYIYLYVVIIFADVPNFYTIYSITILYNYYND